MKRHLVLALALTLGGSPAPLLAAGPEGVAIVASKEHVDFSIGNELVTRYHVGPEVAKPYFWPLNAPGGVPVTRAWPMEPASPAAAPTTSTRNPPGSATATSSPKASS